MASSTYSITQTLFAKIGFFILALGAGVIVARWLGPEGKGVYTIILLVASMTVSIGSLNIGETAIYFYNREGVSFGAILGTNYLFILVSSSLYIAIIIFLWWLGLLPWKELSSGWHLVAVLAFIILIFLSLHTNDILRCRKQFSDYNIVHLLQPFVYGLLVLLLVASLNLGLIGALVAAAISYVVMIGAGITYILRGEQLQPRFDGTYLRSSMAYGLKGHIGNIFQKFNLRLDQFFISPYWGAAMLGNYSVAVAFCELIWYVPDSMGIVNLTRIAELEEPDAVILTQKSSRMNIIATLVLVVGFYFCSRPAITLLYGTPFEAAISAVYWLLPGVWAMGFSKVISKYFSGRGRPEINTLTSFVSSLATVALCFLLIPQYGIVGAAMASSLAYLLRATLDIIIFLKMTRTLPGKLLIPSVMDFRLLCEIGRNYFMKSLSLRGKQ